MKRWTVILKLNIVARCPIPTNALMLLTLTRADDGKLEALRGTVEVDESFFGGKEGNKHERHKLKAGRGAVGKTTVLGMRERGHGGRTLAMPIEGTTVEKAKKRKRKPRKVAKKPKR